MNNRFTWKQFIKDGLIIKAHLQTEQQK